MLTCDNMRVLRGLFMHVEVIKNPPKPIESAKTDNAGDICRYAVKFARVCVIYTERVWGMNSFACSNAISGHY